MQVMKARAGLLITICFLALTALVVYSVTQNSTGKVEVRVGAGRPATVIPLTSGGQGSDALPAGFSSPRELVGDPSGTGVWYLSESNEGPRLFYEAVSRPADGQSWALTSKYGLGGILNGLAVDNGRVAWAGFGDTLFRVDPTAQQVQTIPLPNPPIVAAAEQGLPSPVVADLNAECPVIGVAVDDHGDVAIAREYAAAVQIYHSGSGQFIDAPLPANTTASSAMAFDSDSVLALALNDPAARFARTELYLWDPAGTSRTIDASVGYLHATGNSFTVGSVDLGELTTVVGSPGPAMGETTSTTFPVSSVGASGPTADLRLGPGGYVVYQAKSGIGIDTPSGHALLFSLPKFSCPNPGMLGSGPTVSSCQDSTFAIAVDAAGNVWYASTAPDAAIGVISPAAYER
jgi:hypothetical protein